jgi:type IV pilus assembly protein PilB
MRPTAALPSAPSGLPRALLQAGKLSQQQIDVLQRDASNERIPFIDHLIRSGEMDAKALALFCATHFGCP